MGAARQDKHNIPTLLKDSCPIHNTKDKANDLNSHFKSVFAEENLSTMDTTTDIPNILNIFISQSGIHQLLTTLNVCKARGPDHISLYILKHCEDEISPVLHIIFNQSLSTSQLPCD